MLGGTCHVALVATLEYTDNQHMSPSPQPRRLERGLSWLVALGVAATGIYDFAQGAKPRGIFGIDPNIALVAFLGGCLAFAILAAQILADGNEQHRARYRHALLVMSFFAIAFTDPTYGSLLLVIPIIEIRRRDEEPLRTALVLAVIVAVGVLLATEDTPAAGNAHETMLAIAISFLVVVVLGDVLRQLDTSIELESEVAQLSERSRIAEELHDSLGHHLLASSVQLQKAKALRDRDPKTAATAVDYASDAIAEAISETRLIVDATRDDEQFAVEPSIRELARRIVPAETAIDVQISGDHQRLDATTQLALYRIVQEALTNLVRHSTATTARIISTATSDSFTVEITDNGGGFDVQRASAPGGIGNMRRRIEALGGTLSIASASDGTSVKASVPR